MPRSVDLSRLIAIDGVNGAALMAAARRFASPGRGRRRVGISRWDASGLFEQLIVAGDAGGAPSIRTLLLLYAADLTFRLRWEIEPALAEGRTVIAAPYVETAISFGRAAGLRGGWLSALFRFAPRPAERHYVDVPVGRASANPPGFVEFSCARLAGDRLVFSPRELESRAEAQLRARATRAHTRRVIGRSTRS